MSRRAALVALCVALLCIDPAIAVPDRCSFPRRSLLQPGAVTAVATATAVAKAGNPDSSSTGDWLAHQCLWTPTATTMASAVAVATSSGSVATATASATASATATATATASATATITEKATVPAGTCTLNPSYFFSLQAGGQGPSQDSEKLLLQITAMRYACTNHTAESHCSMDQPNWCVWQDEGKQGKGQCLLQFGDADFVHFLMWSGTRLPCAGSKVSQVVECSFQVSSADCITNGCQWTEGACYPKWYAGILTKPKPLASFKRQVHVADPEVWGSCVATDMYRQYSSICNHQTQDACRKDPAGCIFLTEYETEVAQNPLNFSKPCMISSSRFPLESVFLGGTASRFASAVMDAQMRCRMTTNNEACKANTTSLNSNVLQSALAYSASTTVAVAPSSPAPGGAVTGPDLTASWGLPGFMQLPLATRPPNHHDAAGQVPASPTQDDVHQPHTGTAGTTVVGAGINVPIMQVKPPALPTLPTLSLPTGISASSGGSVAASASASARTGLISAGDTFKGPAVAGTLLKPIRGSEWFASDLFGIAEATYVPGKANYPGTKAALSSLKILLRRKP